MKTSVKSALVRHSGALAIALLAFSFSGSHAVRAQDPEVSTPTLSEMVFAPIMKAVEGIEQRLSNIEATWALFKVSFNSDHMVTRQLCIADDSGAQTCITKAQLDIVLATMTHAEAPKPTEATVQAAAETPAAEPVIVAEAAVEPEIAAQPSAEPVEAAVEEPVQTTNTEQQVEIAPESTEAEHTGSLPAPGAALIWYPDVETTLP
jgi:FtsZ-interacting cell division protein ZipA